MTYYQFVQAIEQRLKRETEANVCINIHKVRKYNGAVRQGILFSEKKSNISPTIYLEEYYRRFNQGDTLDMIVREILVLYHKLCVQKSWMEEFTDQYEHVKDKIVYRIINRKANEELLQGMPYIPYLDLAIVFYVQVRADVCGTAVMAVLNEHLKLWGVTEEQVYERACENTCRLIPCELSPMKEILTELTGVEDVVEEEEELYILSNSSRCYGAAAILYPGCLEWAGEILGGDYYVFPSSVHEVILMRKREDMCKSFLDKMVREINETQVDEEEVLSDRAYYYDVAQKKLNM